MSRTSQTGICWMRARISIRRSVDPHRDRKRHLALKVRWLLSFNKQDQIEQMEAFLKPAENEKLTALVLTRSLYTAIMAPLRLIQRVVCTSFIAVNSYILFPPKWIHTRHRKKWLRWFDTVLKEKCDHRWRIVGVRLWEIVRSSQKSETYPKEQPLKTLFYSLKSPTKDYERRIDCLCSMR